jgi:hypothetical protein
MNEMLVKLLGTPKLRLFVLRFSNGDFKDPTATTIRSCYVHSRRFKQHRRLARYPQR